MGMGLGTLGSRFGRLGNAPSKGVGVPSWASGTDLWEDFTVPRGPLADPTDTHASTIYAPNAAGVYLPFAANVLTRTDLGLQTVPTRTNSIRNNSAAGAVAGTPGTLPNFSLLNLLGTSREIVGVGTDVATGIPYYDLRCFGTPSSTGIIQLKPDGNAGAISGASAGQVWAYSAFVALVAGSLTNIGSVKLGVSEYSAGPTYLRTGFPASNILAGGATMTRVSGTQTLGASATIIEPDFQFAVTSGLAIDFTIRIAGIQLELGAFATAPILTTTASATVNGNQQVIDLTGRLGTGVAGIWQGRILQPIPASGNAQILNFNDGTSANRLNLYITAGGGITVGMDTASVGQGSVDISGFVQDTLLTVAFCWAGNFFTGQVVGSSAPTADTVSTFPSGLSRVTIGSRPTSTDETFQRTSKLALSFGPQDATTFAAALARAQIAAVS